MNRRPLRTNRRHLLSALAGAGLAGAAGCVSADSAPEAASTPATDALDDANASAPAAGTPLDAEASTDALVAGNVNFGFALLDRLAADAPNRNRFLSPYSVGVALAMAAAGARGTTRENLAETMRFPASGEDLRRAWAALRSALPLGHLEEASGTTSAEDDSESTEADVGYETTAGEGESESDGQSFTLVGANALWGQAGYPFREDFLDALTRYYGTGLGTVNFRETPDAARRAINAWVAERTREKVPELFPKGTIDRRTRLVLANAVYFRANWATTFEEDDTEQKQFTALDDSTGEVAMMRQQDRFGFASVDGTEVLELPYAGGNTDVVVLLPPREGFREFEQSLDADRLDRLVGATETQEVDVGLPRFEFRAGLQLGSHLRAMGMTTAFTPRANFDGVAEGDADANLALGAVLHEAYVRVDEQGTEAAAATGVEMELTSATPDPAEFVADRPFLFVIRHRPTGTPLFVGRMADATVAQ